MSEVKTDIVDDADYALNRALSVLRAEENLATRNIAVFGRCRMGKSTLIDALLTAGTSAPLVMGATAVFREAIRQHGATKREELRQIGETSRAVISARTTERAIKSHKRNTQPSRRGRKNAR